MRDDARKAAADLMRVLFAGVSGLEGDAAWADTVERGDDDNYPVAAAFTAFEAQIVERCLGVLRDYIMDVSDTDSPDASVVTEHCQNVYERVAAIRESRNG